MAPATSSLRETLQWDLLPLAIHLDLANDPEHRLTSDFAHELRVLRTLLEQFRVAPQEEAGLGEDLLARLELLKQRELRRMAHLGSLLEIVRDESAVPMEPDVATAIMSFSPDWGAPPSLRYCQTRGESKTEVWG